MPSSFISIDESSIKARKIKTTLTDAEIKSGKLNVGVEIIKPFLEGKAVIDIIVREI